MNIEVSAPLKGHKQKIWKDFLIRCGIRPDENVEQTVLIWEESELIATGSRQDNILKCIAVDSTRRGEDLTATLLTTLRKEAFKDGLSHLFLYTKPEYEQLFTSLFFYPVARTENVLLMENRKNGIVQFLESLPIGEGKDRKGDIGAAVMNCDPFTLGHRYLIETAAKECSHVYVFVLSEEKSRFSFADRLEMVRLGTKDLHNVTVLPTGPYLISSATFPTYFLKDREKAEEIQCLLDIEIFIQYYVPYFGITRRFVGTEPLSPMTEGYNRMLEVCLPTRGIMLTKLPRLQFKAEGIEDHKVPISAKAVRALVEEGNLEGLQYWVPQTTLDYLRRKK